MARDHYTCVPDNVSMEKKEDSSRNSDVKSGKSRDYRVRDSHAARRFTE